MSDHEWQQIAGPEDAPVWLRVEKDDTPTPAAPAGGEWTSGYSELFEYFTVYQGTFDAGRLSHDQFLTPDEQSSKTAERVLNALTADLTAVRAEVEQLRTKASLVDWLLERLTVATYYPGTENEYQALAEPHHGEPLETEQLEDLLYEWVESARRTI